MSSLLAWRGDSVAVDAYSQPLVIVPTAGGAGRTVSWWSEFSARVSDRRALFWWFPDFAVGDGDGRLLGVQDSEFDGEGRSSLDSARIIRFSVDSLHLDTIASFSGGDAFGATKMVGERRSRLKGYAVTNRWSHLGGDTTVLVNASEYRLQIIADRREITAFTIPFAPIPVDRAHWRRTADSASEAWARYTNSQRGRPGLPPSPKDAPRLVYPEPPRMLPPVRYDGWEGPLPLAGRRLFVPVADPDVTDGFDPWEIIDLDARCRLGRVLLRPNERIIGADNDGVVIARRDSVDLHTLARVLMPDTPWRGPAATCDVEEPHG